MSNLIYTFLIYVMVFLSGASALLFETLWFHQNSLVLGNSVWASSVVLAGFMGGLALGNGLAGKFGQRMRRPLRTYAFLELVVGISGIGLLFFMSISVPLLNPLFQPFLEQPIVLNGLRLGIAFLVMLLPATAMGATLPFLVNVLFTIDPHFGSVLGRLYGLNTLGAVVGALLGQGFLIESCGVYGTACVAAAANLVVAGAGLKLAFVKGNPSAEPVRLVKKIKKHSVKVRKSAVAGAGQFGIKSSQTAAGGAGKSTADLPRRAVWLLAAAWLCGAILLALEVVWFRFLILFLLPGGFAFALMLAIVLAGIGLGGLMASRWLVADKNAYKHLPAVALSAGIVTIATYVFFDLAGGELLKGIVLHWPGMLKLGLPLMLPGSLLSGVLFTLLGEAVNNTSQNEIRTTGILSLANTTGAMVGSLLGGFVLLPMLGMERSIFVLAALYGGVALLTVLYCLLPLLRTGPRLWTGAWSRTRIVFFGLAGAFVVSLSLFPTGLMANRYIQYPLKRVPGENATPVEIREGLTETIIYTQTHLYGEPRFHRLTTNSYSMSTTSLQSRRYMQLFVYLPVAVHPGIKNALLISYGVGATAKALTDTRSLETIDVVDISRDILELGRVPFPNEKDNPLLDPRVNVHVEDGRFFLQTSEKRFDLITGEPPPPKAAGVVNLFTKEYFQLVRDRLTDGGIASYWLPTHSLEETESKAVTKAFCDVFDDCSLWSGAGLDLILLGTRDAKGPVSNEQFTRQWRDPVVGPELRRLGIEMPQQLGALFIAGKKELAQLTQEVPPVTDNYPGRIGPKPVNARQMAPVYWPWLDTQKARAAFTNSPQVKKLWPVQMQKDSLPYFEFQTDLNELMLGAPTTLRHKLARMDLILTRSKLQTLVLWRLGRSAETQSAGFSAAKKGKRDAMLELEAAALTLSRRDYKGAARYFERMALRGVKDPQFLFYQLYATCRDGNHQQAKAIAQAAGLSKSKNAQIKSAWQFLSKRCGV